MEEAGTKSPASKVGQFVELVTQCFNHQICPCGDSGPELGPSDQCLSYRSTWWIRQLYVIVPQCGGAVLLLLLTGLVSKLDICWLEYLLSAATWRFSSLDDQLFDVQRWCIGSAHWLISYFLSIVDVSWCIRSAQLISWSVIWCQMLLNQISSLVDHVFYVHHWCIRSADWLLSYLMSSVDVSDQLIGC